MRKLLRGLGPVLKGLRCDGVTGRTAGCLFGKLLYFDVLWCAATTFTPFSRFSTWWCAGLVAAVLALPWVLSRRRWLAVAVLLAADAWLVANLMYARTYYTPIPLESYLMAGNLADFMQSVIDSLRWADALFPASTLAVALWMYRRPKPLAPVPRLRYVAGVSAACLFTFGAIGGTGGFVRSYAGLRLSAHLFASGPALYTLAGTLFYDANSAEPVFTEAERRRIEGWLAERPAPVTGDSLPVRRNCVVILAESLESWVLEREVEGQRITPWLDSLLRDPATFYAPRVLTQVKGGRSIDAQLLLLAGLLPVNSGTYSVQYPTNRYLTLQKALKERWGTRNYLLTVDKEKTWNQAVIARQFGIDTLLAYADFRLTDEAFGNRKRAGDRSFFRQCQEKMERGEVWPVGEAAFVQCVTYSGHAPFVLPEELKSISFSERIPDLMNRYMTTAHYTDEAIGRFVAYLRSRPDYAETLVVITGDHEGLASYRKDLCATEAGRGVVSDRPFTPFIVLNSPVGGRYEAVMGQVDMYPTLLQLLGLGGYAWTGLGESVLSARKPPFAVSPQLEVVGEATDTTQVRRLREAYDIADVIIRFDYFAR